MRLGGLAPITGIAGPACLQRVTETFTGGTIVIDEVLMPAGAAAKDGHRGTGADTDRRGAVTQRRFGSACRFAVHAVGGDDEAGLSGFERAQQGTARRSQAAAAVGQARRLGQAQRLSQNTHVAAIGVG